MSELALVARCLCHRPDDPTDAVEIWLKASGARRDVSYPNSDVRSGSWLCKNVLAKAQTGRAVGQGAIRGDFPWLGGFSPLEALLTWVPVVLKGLQR